MSCFIVMSKSLIHGQRTRVGANVVVLDAVTLHQDNSQSSPETISCVVCTVFTWVQSQSSKCIQPLRDTLISIAWLCTEAGEQCSRISVASLSLEMLTSGAATVFPTAVVLTTAGYIEHQLNAVVCCLHLHQLIWILVIMNGYDVDRSFRLPSKFSWIYSIKIDDRRRELENFTRTSPGLSFLP